MQKDSTYWRARLDTIQQIITEEKGGDRSERINNAVLLRNGIIPDELKDLFEKAFKKQHDAWIKIDNKQPLSFSEITRFNTWFQLHPEKVAGKEIITTSREFPISIKGSESDIINTINKTLRKKQDDKRLRTVKIRAKAKLKMLTLLSTKNHQ